MQDQHRGTHRREVPPRGLGSGEEDVHMTIMSADRVHELAKAALLGQGVAAELADED
ncbi:MAG: hypothetical protein QOE61_4053 [Micromonosporaceae bacterium]|jgi:hypothetical protein|nr:hypothetical protein [Micromonosporaceae bacterium]